MTKSNDNDPDDSSERRSTPQPVGDIPDDYKKWTDHDHVRYFLRSRNAMCPECQYNLRDLESQRCPECGKNLTLTIGLKDKSSRGWITMLVGLWASTGSVICLFVIVLVLGTDGDLPPLELSLIIYYVLLVPMGILLLLKRHWFVTLKEETQGLLSFLAWAAAVVSALSIASLLIHVAP